jgi:hypothetical protein
VIVVEVHLGHMSQQEPYQTDASGVEGSRRGLSFSEIVFGRWIEYAAPWTLHLNSGLASLKVREWLMMFPVPSPSRV